MIWPIPAARMAREGSGDAVWGDFCAGECQGSGQAVKTPRMASVAAMRGESS
jgi:hypothetical protein